MPPFDPEAHARRHEGDLEQLREYYGAHPRGKRYGRPERGGNAVAWMILALAVTLAGVSMWAVL